jgi:ribokinase
MTFDVVVVGSVNRDLTLFTKRHPRPGETVLGSEHRWSGGGKGANQAVAAARLGARTAFIGRTGDDEHGRALRASLNREGIDLSCFGTDPETPTGLAVITIDETAENSIIVSPGANSTLSPDRVRECEVMLDGAKVVLAQLEIPLDTVMASAVATSGRFCLNPAPARGPKRLLRWHGRSTDPGPWL